MADNYLERKMEEHRRVSQPRKISAGPIKGKLSFNFPPRRVLLFDLDKEITARLARAYGESGCRVALYPETALTNTDGSRQINSTNNPAVDLSGVLKAWGDIDIVVSSVETQYLNDVMQAILTRRESLPYPNDYGLRLIAIGDTTPPLTTEYTTCFIQTKLPIKSDAILKIVPSVLFLSLNDMSNTNIKL
ncbi:MAG: hypothetical protein K2H44_01715 [Muribaculaceae bacterium]|nr:hypothetical protein [Muribaculaceae bacterium]MDE5844091.1 hypothetical protein [Muribaculaceae bacterium]